MLNGGDDMDGIDRERAVRLWGETEKNVHQRGASYEKDPSSMKMDPFRIFGDLYYIGDRVVCIHLLDTEEGLVLFDSGFPHAVGSLLDSVRSLGFSPSNIKYIFHTHEHFDHFGASRRLQIESGSKTCLHELGAEVFRLHPHHTEIQSAHCPDASLFIPDIELKDGDSIQVGQYVITCKHSPGHSAGSVSYFFDLEADNRKIKAGICGANGNLPLHPGRLLKYGIPLSAGDEYLATIAGLMDLSVDLALDTHPRPDGIVDRKLGGADYFVDAALWQNTLVDYRTRYFEMITKFEKSMRAD